MSAVNSTEQPKAVCDPSLFLARPAEKPLSDRSERSAAKAVSHSSLFMALSGISISTSPSEDRKPVGSADLAKEAVEFYDHSLQPEEDVMRCAESLINSLSRHDPGNAQLYSIGRGPVQPTLVKNNLLIVDFLPRYARNEKVLLPKDSEPPKNRNDLDKYGYLNTSLQEIKVMPEPIYTVGRDSQAPEFVAFDEFPSQRGVWTPISCCEPDCFLDQWKEPSSICHEFGKPIAAEKATKPLTLDQRHNIEAPVNPYSIAIKDRETIADYVKSVDKVNPNSHQKNMVERMKKKGIEKRTRRKLEEGSYNNLSVDEKKLFGRKDKILRFTWKGKLLKLRKLLKDTKTQAYINRQDYCGRTALHYAASWDCPQTMKLLLSVPGVNVNLQDAGGKTPLRKACEIKSLSCVKVLVEFGANLLIAGTDRRNPFEYVLQEQGDDGLELAMYLYNDAQMCKEKREGGIVSHLHQLCLAKVKVVKLAEELIKSGATINATEGSGKTPLILASKMNHPELLNLFLKYKADVMHVDLECYKNALEYAVPGEACYKMIKREMTLQLQESKRRTTNPSIERFYQNI